jgi:hypothetical protein
MYVSNNPSGAMGQRGLLYLTLRVARMWVVSLREILSQLALGILGQQSQGRLYPASHPLSGDWAGINWYVLISSQSLKRVPGVTIPTIAPHPGSHSLGGWPYRDPMPPDLDCGDIGRNNFTVRPPNPHRFDGDRDGVGCEVSVAPPPAATSPTPSENCHPSYPDVCIPPPPPDLDCGEIPYRRFRVVGSDPHRFDGDNDGVGCESR